MKLVFEIAVDRKTRTRDQTFEGVPTPEPQPPTGARGVATPIFGQFLFIHFCPIWIKKFMRPLATCRAPIISVLGMLGLIWHNRPNLVVAAPQAPVGFGTPSKVWSRVLVYRSTAISKPVSQKVEGDPPPPPLISKY